MSLRNYWPAFDLLRNADRRERPFPGMLRQIKRNARRLRRREGRRMIALELQSMEA